MMLREFMCLYAPQLAEEAYTESSVKQILDEKNLHPEIYDDRDSMIVVLTFQKKVQAFLLVRRFSKRVYIHMNFVASIYAKRGIPLFAETPDKRILSWLLRIGFSRCGFMDNKYQLILDGDVNV